MDEDEIIKAFGLAVARGCRTKGEIVQFITERLTPMVHIEVPKQSRQDKEERRISFSLTIATPSVEEH